MPLLIYYNLNDLYENTDNKLFKNNNVVGVVDISGDDE